MFKFSPDFKSNIWGENDEKIMQDFGDKLKSYSLFTFEELLFAKMLTFANTIVGNGSSSRKLKELIKEKSIDEEISDFGSYALRSVSTLNISELHHLKCASNMINNIGEIMSSLLTADHTCRRSEKESPTTKIKYLI